MRCSKAAYTKIASYTCAGKILACMDLGEMVI